MQAATAAVQGVMGGDLKAALANGAAPFIANEIKKQIPDEETDANLKRTIAHGIANAALALAKGENVAAQAAGAMTGEAIGILAEYIYNKQPGELTEQEKENVSVWATLASGLAGGLAGGDIQSVAGFAPIFPDTCYHLTHYWLAAVDIPVASDNPVHYADAIRYNARTPLQGSLLPLTRLVWA